MPRYHFDVIGKNTMADRMGLLLPDDTHVSDAADRLASELYEIRPELRARECAVLVTDDDGEEVHRAAHYDDRDHPLRRIATTCYDRLRPVKAPLGPLGDSQYSQMASSGVEAVPVVNRRDPRALRSAPTADAAARAGGPC